MKLHAVILSMLMIGSATVTYPQAQDAAMTVAEEMTAKFIPARRANDAEAIAALFTTDGVFNVLPKAIMGHQLIVKFLASQRVTQFDANIRQARAIGDAIWAVGGYTITPASGENTSKQISGVWGNVLVREGNDWRIAMLTASEAPTK